MIAGKDIQKSHKLNSQWSFTVPQEPETKPESHVNNAAHSYMYLLGLNAGKEKAIKDLKKNIVNKHSELINKAQKIAESFFNSINKKGLICNSVYLRPEGIGSFKLLFIVNQESYLSDKFSDVYGMSIKERKKSNKDDFYISFMFMPQSKSLDTSKIESDGFVYSYYGEKTRK